MNRVTVWIGLLFLLALGLSLPNWLSEDSVKPKLQTEEAWVPNYVAITMRSTLYNQQGKINHQVFAQKMEHFDLLGFTLFKKPQYTLYTQTGEPWHINAMDGTLYDDQRLQFENDVQIFNANEAGQIQKIETGFIEVNLVNKVMTTDQAVEISGENLTINSNGIKANLESQQYEFTDHVKTIYQPRS